MSGLQNAKAKTVIDVVVAAVLVGLSFVGMTNTDITATGGQVPWSGMTAVFLGASLLLIWLHSSLSKGLFARHCLHWICVLVAIQLVYVFILTGRVNNPDAALANGLIVALGTLLCGVHAGISAGWRLALIGLALGVGTLVVALLEQYALVLLAIAIVMVIIIILGDRLMPKRSQPVAPAT